MELSNFIVYKKPNGKIIIDFDNNLIWKDKNCTKEECEIVESGQCFNNLSDKIRLTFDMKYKYGN